MPIATVAVVSILPLPYERIGLPAHCQAAPRGRRKERRGKTGARARSSPQRIPPTQSKESYRLSQENEKIQRAKPPPSAIEVAVSKSRTGAILSASEGGALESEG